MRAVGHPSWHITCDAPYDLHLALFVRDSLGLGGGPIGKWPAPPPLHRRLEVPALRHLGTATAHADALQHWPQWWDSLLDAGPVLDVRALRRMRHAASGEKDLRLAAMLQGSVCTPELRALVRSCAEVARTWDDRRKRLVPDLMCAYHPRMPQIGNALQSRRNAIAGAAQVNATIDFLMVEGSGVIIHTSGRVLFWGDALDDSTTRTSIVDALA
jgi:hypothetical protein